MAEAGLEKSEAGPSREKGRAADPEKATNGKDNSDIDTETGSHPWQAGKRMEWKQDHLDSC